jgi:hypothetical protein
VSKGTVLLCRRIDPFDDPIDDRSGSRGQLRRARECDARRG